MSDSGTFKSIVEFSNFFDHQLYIHIGTDGSFYSVKQGVSKKIKFPPHLMKLLNEKGTLTKTVMNGSEKSVLHIFRLGDGHTLFLNDPGTGTVLNGFILSLITLSSNVCNFNSNIESDSGMNDVLLDKLVAEFDKEKHRFAITDKRQKEEIIILEEQAKEAYNQMASLENTIKAKEADIIKLRKQFSELAGSHKAMEKEIRNMSLSSDFQVSVDLKKKNQALEEKNKSYSELLKKLTLSFNELKSDVEMALNDSFDQMELPDEFRGEVIENIKKLFADKIS